MFALDYVTGMVQANHGSLNLNVTHQVLVYADDNLLVKNMHAI